MPLRAFLLFGLTIQAEVVAVDECGFNALAGIFAFRT